jgi:hypothetical protein
MAGTPFARPAALHIKSVMRRSPLSRNCARKSFVQGEESAAPRLYVQSPVQRFSISPRESSLTGAFYLPELHAIVYVVDRGMGTRSALS